MGNIGRDKGLHRDYQALEAATLGAALISCDVFDTLLLRTLRAERSRIVLAERRFHKLLRAQGIELPLDTLIDSRLRVQRSAFRVLNVGGSGEARLVDIVTHQHRLLGLPAGLLDERLRIELAIERRSLVANHQLAELLRARRQTGARVIAISDTTLSAAQVQELIDHLHGPGLVDHVYASADHAATKRDGSLFRLVSRIENIPLSAHVHVGDDPEADVRVPAKLGIRALHLRRPTALRRLRTAQGLATETRRQLVRAVSAPTTPPSPVPETFAAEIFGPIVAHFCTLIWLYVSQLERTDSAVLLFCARGGIGIREAFERVVSRLQLPLASRRENLPVSRLVAARAALLMHGSSAIDELGREFVSESFADVARALGGRSYQLPEEWQRQFVAGEFFKFLHSAAGAPVLADLREQNSLFARELRRLSEGAQRVVLCDTGLYGSTQRLLAQGFRDMKIETVQFARANYKDLGDEHFARVTGLLVQQNAYDPLDAATSVLRYWHLVESLFEPKLPSVRSFQLDPEGNVTANCGAIDFGSFGPASFSELLNGVLQYIDRLTPAAAAEIGPQAERSFRQLKRAITRPSPDDLRSLSVGTRSADFGREKTMEVMSQAPALHMADKLRMVTSQHWHEGAIARDFPTLKHVLLPAVDSVHLLRRLVGKR